MTILPKFIAKKHFSQTFNAGFSFVALNYSHSGVKILKLGHNKTYSFIYHLKTPSFIKPNTFEIQTAWGESGFHGANNSWPALLTGYGKYLVLTKFIVHEEED